jgi:hypothetical protein
MLVREFCDSTLASVGAGLRLPPTDCGTFACQSLRLRFSFVRGCAYALCHAKHPQTVWREDA